MARHLLASCVVDGLLLGIDVEQVQEVVSGAVLTAVPLAPPVLAGLLNLRGQIVTAIDVRRCLGLATRPADARVHVILKVGETSVSMLVDHMGDVHEVDDEAFEAAPEALRGPLRELIRGVYKLDSRLLLVLDTARLIARITKVNSGETCLESPAVSREPLASIEGGTS